MLDNASTTNNYELDKLCYKIFGDDYKGTYSANNIKHEPKRNGECMIVNNQNVEEGGEHWMAVYNECGKNYLFDTYSRDYKSLNKNFVKKSWIQPKHRIMESVWASDCGQQCIAFIITCRKYGAKLFFMAFE